MRKLSGVMPALVTPFDAAGAIDFAAFRAHLRALRAAWVSGWVPCGSSGEYNLMSDAEEVILTRVSPDDFGDTSTTVAGVTPLPSESTATLDDDELEKAPAKADDGIPAPTTVG